MKTSHQTRKHAERLAEIKNQHDREIAQTERRQTRLANAYVDLLELTEPVRHWATLVRPMPIAVPGIEPAEFPDPAIFHRVEALVPAYGSEGKGASAAVE